MTAMTSEERKALRRLKELGWDDAPKLLRQWCPKGFARLLKRYQRMHGIKADGKLGPITKRSLEALRVCGLPEQMGVGRSCKWPHLDVTWAIASTVPSFSLSQRKEIFAEAAARWNAVCGIRLTYTANTKTANIVVHGVRLDGPSGVLADMQLPCNARQNSQIRGRTDTSERWKYFDGPGANGELDLARTDAHELGHAMGIPHIKPGNLLQPMWDQNIWTPQAGDIEEAVARYGKGEQTPDTPKEGGQPADPDRIQTIQIQYLGQKPFAVKY